MNQSIITEYYDDQAYSQVKINQSSVQNRDYSPMKSRQQLYTGRLQNKIKQLQHQIKKNRPILEQIRTQRKFFKKISDKQRQKIQQTNVKLLKEQYDAQVRSLQSQKLQLQQLIQAIHQDSRTKLQHYSRAKEEIHNNYLQLKDMLADVNEENADFKTILMDKDEQIDIHEKKLNQLQQQIQAKHMIRTKYQETLKKIQKLEQAT